MKIKQLQFKNINSLYGRWSMNFEDQAFTDNGIFAITGPTGAGKSSIFDAVCLALFGKTPRQEQITSKTNEVMTKGTGDCFAELIFNINGVDYKAHWSQKRSRGHADGRLQPIKHRVINAADDTEMVEGISKVKEFIEDITGMDFERFSRSIMLAQGKFKEFLEADNKERASLLEDITGSHIYSKISKHVYNEKKLRETAIKETETKLNEHHVLSNDDLTSIQEQQEKLSTSLKALDELIKQQHKDVTLKRSFNEAIAKLKESEDALSEINKHQKAYASDEKRLDGAQRALQVNASYMLMDATRKQRAEVTAVLHELKAALPQSERNNLSYQKEFQQAQSKLQAFETAHKDFKELIKKVQKIDNSIEQLQEKHTEQTKELADCTAEQEGHVQTVKDLDRSQSELRKEHVQLEGYQKEHSIDVQLESDLSGIDALIGQHNTESAELVERKQALQVLKSEHKDASKDIAVLKEEITEAENSIAQADKELAAYQSKEKDICGGRTRERYQQEQAELLHLAMHSMSQQDLRNQLQEGEACCVCGSTVHPYVRDGYDPEKRSNELNKEKQRYESYITKQSELANQSRATNKTLHTYQKRLTKLEIERSQFDEKFQVLHDELERLEHEHSQTISKLEEALQPYGFDKLPKGFTQLQRELSKRKDEWLRVTSRMSSVLNTISINDKSIKHNKNDIKKLETRISAASDKQRVLQVSIEGQRKERDSLFGSKRVEDEEIKHEQARELCLNTVEDARRKCNESRDKLTRMKQQVASKNTDLNNLESKLQEEQTVFEAHCIQHGFNNEQVFLNERMNEEDLINLTSVVQERKKYEQQIRHGKDIHQKQLAEIELQKPPTDSIDALEGILAQSEQQRKEAAREEGSLKQQLIENEREKKHVQSLQSTLSKQQEDIKRWALLDELIGSSDGNKFRLIAQSLTFELLIQQANKQLQQIMDRYTIIQDRDPKQLLSLLVIDNHQAGCERAISNLSGGESFIVSLALALGLAQMSNAKYPMETLFIDEGFGTLDEDTLHTALNVLSELQQHGRLIGVISHMEQLKCSISTKVEVNKLVGGLSEITGPGCRYIDLVKVP